MTRFALVLLLVLPAPTHAQESEGDQAARVEARRLFREAQAHDEAGRPALAAQSYLATYEVMRRAGLPRAPLVLHAAGRALAQIPGREREARETFERFLSESTPLTEDAEVRDLRSNALEQITELDARLALGDVQESTTGAGEQPQVSQDAARDMISPVGPVVLAFGGIALLSGVVLAGLVLSQDAELAALCDVSAARCPQSARPFAEEIERLAIASDVLLITGGTAALVGIVLTILLRDGPAAEPDVSMACSQDGCVAQFAGSF